MSTGITLTKLDGLKFKNKVQTNIKCSVKGTAVTSLDWSESGIVR
jgi:hypothetical protein